MNSTSLNEIAYSLLNEIRGGRSSNTESISVNQIKYLIKYYRATFIRRDFWRNNNRFRSFEQDLGSVPVEIISNDNDSGIELGALVMRTTKQLPSPIRLKEFEGITHISSGLGSVIPLLDAQRGPWEAFNKYNHSSSYATFRGGHIYVFNDITLDSVNIRGVFEDPEKVHEFTQSNGLDLYNDNSPFPITLDMLEGIKKAILGAELKTLASTPTDDEANNQQDSQ